jgi:hypothetical protein
MPGKLPRAVPLAALFSRKARFGARQYQSASNVASLVAVMPAERSECRNP